MMDTPKLEEVISPAVFDRLLIEHGVPAEQHELMRKIFGIYCKYPEPHQMTDFAKEAAQLTTGKPREVAALVRLTFISMRAAMEEILRSRN